MLATFQVESGRAWGRDHHLRVAPTGFLLGVVSVAQMFLAIEPFASVIIDLRTVTVLLACVFLHTAAALISASKEIWGRWGIGGTGMMAGISVIGLRTSETGFSHAARKNQTEPCPFHVLVTNPKT